MGIIFRYLFARRIYSCFEVLKSILDCTVHTFLLFQSTCLALNIVRVIEGKIM